MRSASLLVAAVVAVLILHFGRAAVGGYAIADRSYGEDVYHLTLLYERWAAYVGEGHLPAWMPEFGGGYPAPAAWMYGLLSPGLALFLILPPAVAWTWTGILHIAFGALGVFHLLRAYGSESEGAATAGLLFAFSGSALGRMLCGHLNLVMPLAWGPWVLWQVLRTVRGERAAVPLLALTTALGLVAGHVQLWFYLAPLGVLVAVGEWWPERPVRAVPRLLAAAVLALLLAAPQWLATAGLLGQAGSGGTDPLLREAGAVPLDHLLAASVPGVLGEPFHTYWAQEVFEHEFLWIGGAWLVLPLVLAWRMRDRVVVLWGAAAVVGLLVAVRAPWTGLLHELPPLSVARSPGRVLVVPLLAICVVAGLGVDRWLRALPEQRAARWRSLRLPAALAAVAAVAGPLAALFGRVGSAPLVQTFAGELSRGALMREIVFPAVVLSLAGVLVVAVALARAESGDGRRWLPAVALGLVAWIAGSPRVETVSAEFERTDWSAVLPADVRDGRVHLDGNRFPPIERRGGRTLRELCHVDSAAFQELWRSPSHEAAFWLDVGASAHRQWRGSVFEPPAGLRPDQLLRLERVTHLGPGGLFEARGVPVDMTTTAVIERVLAGDPDLHVEGSAGLTRHARATEGDVRRVADPDPRRVHFDVESRRGGVCFVSEKFHDGWTAAVDGEPVEILRANGAFRAVEVPPGVHRVSFVYRPLAYSLGGWLLIAGLVGCAGVGVADFRRSAS